MKNPATTSEEDEDQGIKERRHNPENCLDRVYQYRIHQDELKRTPSVGQRQRQGSMGAGRRGETGTKLGLCPSLGVLEERGFPLSSAPPHSRGKGLAPPAPYPLPPCLFGDKSNSTTKCPGQESGGEKA